MYIENKKLTVSTRQTFLIYVYYQDCVDSQKQWFNMWYTKDSKKQALYY